MITRKRTREEAGLSTVIPVTKLGGIDSKRRLLNRDTKEQIAFLEKVQ